MLPFQFSLFQGNLVVVTFKNLMAAIAADREFAARLSAKPSESSEDLKNATDARKLFEFIGTYVVIFQDIEAKLDQVEQSHIGEYIISTLSNSQKVDFVQAIIKSSAIANGDPFRTEWLASFYELVQRLRVEGTRRNSIVHSVYILDFMEIGAPPLRSKRKRKRAAPGFDQEEIDAQFITRAISEIAELSFDVGMAFTQLVHWSEPLAKKHPDADDDHVAENRVSDQTARG